MNRNTNNNFDFVVGEKVDICKNVFRYLKNGKNKGIITDDMKKNSWFITQISKRTCHISNGETLIQLYKDEIQKRNNYFNVNELSVGDLISINKSAKRYLGMNSGKSGGFFSAEMKEKLWIITRVNGKTYCIQNQDTDIRIYPIDADRC